MERSSFLVVEDDAAFGRCLLQVLLRRGSAKLVGTCRDATRVLDRGAERWDAFFIDVGLPDGSGLGVLAHARALYPSTPALVLTGDPEASGINAAFDLRADYLAKPFNSERIDRFLQSNGPLAVRLASGVRNWELRYRLSDTEGDLLSRVAKGEAREDIAIARGCCPATIKKHAANLLQKTGDPSLHAAVARLLREVAVA